MYSFILPLFGRLQSLIMSIPAINTCLIRMNLFITEMQRQKRHIRKKNERDIHCSLLNQLMKSFLALLDKTSETDDKIVL